MLTDLYIVQLTVLIQYCKCITGCVELLTALNVFKKKKKTDHKYHETQFNSGFILLPQHIKVIANSIFYL